jgi:hypothetical protein
LPLPRVRHASFPGEDVILATLRVAAAAARWHKGGMQVAEKVAWLGTETAFEVLAIPLRRND